MIEIDLASLQKKNERYMLIPNRGINYTVVVL
jgi:hypothetical protein